MKLLPRLFPVVRVLEVVFSKEEYAIVSWRCRFRNTPVRETYDAVAVSREIVLLTISGQGVVSKPAGLEIAARIRKDPQTFLWSERDETIAFVRRDHVQEVCEKLLAANIYPQRIAVAVTPDEIAREFYTSFRWRTILHPTVESSAFAQSLVRRIALPVLGLFLGVLAVNAILSPSLGRRRQMMQSELEAYERSNSAQIDATTRQKALLAEFAASRPTSCALLCDRIAADVPDRVILTQLSIDPLTKRFEAMKPLQRQEYTAIVSGTAEASSDISAFVDRLASESCFRQVRLANVERERESPRLLFRIEIAL